MSSYQTSRFTGISQALADTGGTFFLEEDVEADIEGEQETLPDLAADDLTSSDSNASLATLPGLAETIAGASKGVADGTEGEYRRLAESCVAFLISQRLIKHRDEFISSSPLPNTPMLIIAWIMSECDSIALDGSGLASEPRSSYSHAQKMRASMTYTFGRICKLGNVFWQLSNSGTRSTGNPSVSTEVATYMVSLRRRKVQGGETATSARAITSKNLEALYDYNHRPENFDIQNFDPRNKIWGGPRTRRALQAIYLIAFLCLLRVDEVLKIQRHHIELIEEDGELQMILTLPFRKTHQFGECKPFVLYAMPPEDAHMCPVHALAEWINESQITTGYIFRRMSSNDRPLLQDVPMTSQQFLELFRNNLLDIGIDPAPYGTHSFRRGGCQYYSSERRWELREICDWGGWSLEFTNLTIVKYLMSWNDKPTQRREDFLNPNRAPATKCFRCGRSCRCA